MAICLRLTVQNNSNINNTELYFSLKEKNNLREVNCLILLLFLGVSLLYATEPNEWWCVDF